MNPKEPALTGQGISAGQQGHLGTTCAPVGTMRPGDTVPVGPPWSGGWGNSHPRGHMWVKKGLGNRSWGHGGAERLILVAAEPRGGCHISTVLSWERRSPCGRDA